MDHDAHLSADDALEETRGASSQPVGNNPLPQDNDPPAAPAANPTGSSLSPDHPTTDSGIDSDEVYDEGLAQAVKAGELDDKAFEEE